MHSNNVVKMLVALLLFVGTAFASAVPDATVTLAGDCNKGVGKPGGVYICTGDMFSGQCTWHEPSDECYKFSYRYSKARSIGPNAGGYCIFWRSK